MINTENNTLFKQTNVVSNFQYNRVLLNSSNRRKLTGLVGDIYL